MRDANRRLATRRPPMSTMRRRRADGNAAAVEIRRPIVVKQRGDYFGEIASRSSLSACLFVGHADASSPYVLHSFIETGKDFLPACPVSRSSTLFDDGANFSIDSSIARIRERVFHGEDSAEHR